MSPDACYDVAKTHRFNQLTRSEAFGEIGMAIQRETSLKRWFSHWKHALIEEHNPEWRDLWDDIAK